LGQIATRGRRVAVDELAGCLAVGAGDAARAVRRGQRDRVAGLGPEDHRPGQVDQRITDRRHLEVDDAGDPGWRCRRPDDVVQLEVPADVGIAQSGTVSVARAIWPILESICEGQRAQYQDATSAKSEDAVHTGEQAVGNIKWPHQHDWSDV